MLKTLDLRRNSYLLVKGAARLNIIDGSIDVFGAILKSGDNVIIPLESQVPVRVINDSKIEVYLSNEDCICEIDYNPIPDSWENTVNKASNAKIIVVLGDVDVGKSGFTLYLANRLIRFNKKVAIVDSDIGQSDVGPPCTIGLSILDKQYPTYWSLPTTDAYFVGDKTPVGHLLPMVVGTREMVDRALSRGVDTVIVNTTGFVYGGVAYALKRYKIEALKPDLIVAIQRADEIEHLLRIFEGMYEIARVDVPKSIVRKNERPLYRRLKISRFFKDPVRLELKISRVKIMNALNGLICDDEELVNSIQRCVGLKPDLILEDARSITIVFSKMISKDKMSNLRGMLSKRYGEVRIATTQFYKGLILGLYDDSRRFLGIGLLEELDFKRDRLIVKTPVRDPDNVRIVYFGYISFNDDLTERVKFKPGLGIV